MIPPPEREDCRSVDRPPRYFTLVGKRCNIPIHPTAIIDPRAILDPTATIGPYVVIDGPVHVGPNTVVDAFALLSGCTEIGANCRIHSGAVIGGLPQDRAYQGGESYCWIGDGTVVREGASIHRGTAQGSSTVVGNRCFIMANAHVGHNCVLGDEVTLVNGALLGGYVQVGKKAFISGNSAVHQFVRIGELAMIGAITKVAQDVPAFFTADHDGSCVGVNAVGIRRANFSSAERDDIKQAYRILYRTSASLVFALEEIARVITTDVGERLLAFLRAPSSRGITCARARLKRRGQTDLAEPEATRVPIRHGDNKGPTGIIPATRPAKG